MKADRILIATMAEPVWLGATALGERLSLRRPIDWPEPIEVEVRRSFPQMDSQTAQARLEMGEARWAELEKEWNS